MNKLSTLTLVAVAMISMTGCCRGSLSRWFCRGDACGSSGGMYEGAELGAGPALLAPSTILPQRPVELPGPITSSST